MNLTSFFFLRPYWLLMLIPVMVLIVLFNQRKHLSGQSAWYRMVDAHLLPHLTLKSRNTRGSSWQVAALAAGLSAAVLAMAGPTWEKIELPAFKTQDPTVVVLSLAQSMNASDLSPSRLARAGHKIRDLLDRAKGGDFGFIIYSDRPFVAAPLTSDTEVISQMLPELSTSLMPVMGNQLNLAIDKATDLLDQVDARSGRIVIIADDAGMNPDQSIAAARKARQAGYRVSVLGAGTVQGAAMQTASGQAIKTRDGQQAFTRLDQDELGKLADVGGGVFVKLTPDSEDIDRILRSTADTPSAVQQKSTDFHSDTWNDMGYWLLIIPVLLAPLAFRKNVLMALLPFGVAIIFSVPAPDAMAANFDNLWQTPDQQGARAFQQGEFGEAAATFENPEWKAGSLYKAGQFDQAAQLYENAETPDRYYNLGNALAKAGKFKPAIDAYDTALKQKPGDPDIQYNRDLVAKLLEQSKQQNEQKQQDQQPSGGEQNQQQSGGEQDQQQSGGEQNKQPSGGEQNQQQSGGEQDQQQSGDEQNQQPSGGEQNQQSSGGEQDQQQPGDAGKQPEPGKSMAQGEREEGKSAFRSAMDKLLQGNGHGQETPEGTSPEQPDTTSDLTELDQAHEQQLRAVPDDPSGLLRARIRQYYSQRYPNG